MDVRESRAITISMGCFAGASVALFVAVYAPALSAVAPGASIRPTGVLPLLAAGVGFLGWVPCVVIGVRQLFVKPCICGLVTIGFGLLQAVAFRLAEWLLLGSRGSHWGA
jgi:hypothetical protein